MRLPAMLCCLLVLSAAASADEGATATLGQLRRLAEGCTGAADCRTVAVGAKACGGPAMYLPWSRRRASAAEVDVLAARYLAQRGQDAAPPGMVSDCRLVGDPGAVCQLPSASASGGGQCVLRRPGPGAPSDPR